jgi:uncharacterized coiled-coil DUF342 family protein
LSKIDVFNKKHDKFYKEDFTNILLNITELEIELDLLNDELESLNKEIDLFFTNVRKLISDKLLLGD